MKSTRICILCMDFVMVTLAEPRLSTVCVIHFVIRPTVLYLPHFIKSLGHQKLSCAKWAWIAAPLSLKSIVDRVEEDPTMSSRILAREAGISQSQVMNVLHENLYHPYHFTPVQELRRPDFQKRVTFCRWLLERDIGEHQFFRNILWTELSLFTRDGMLNLHNWHHYAQQNPFITRNSSFQTRFSLNVGLGVVGDQLIGPYVFQDPLTSATYLDFLEHHLPGLLDVISVPKRAEIIYQHNGLLHILPIPFETS